MPPELVATVTVAAPAKTVYAYLIDPRNYIGLSPLVVDVRDINRSQDPQGRETVSYLAIERFRAGIFKWDNKIRVTITATRPGRQLVSEVVSPGRVRLTATIDLADLAEGTSITETIRIRAPRSLRGFVGAQAASVQQARIAELAGRMAD